MLKLLLRQRGWTNLTGLLGSGGISWPGTKACRLGCGRSRLFSLKKATEVREVPPQMPDQADPLPLQSPKSK